VGEGFSGHQEILVSFELQFTRSAGTFLHQLQVATHFFEELLDMRHLKRRYRRITMSRALKPWTPWLRIEPGELDELLARSRW
jgi:hypothetical protein